jgi:ABC-type molybdenum transport system ATPase subunit/photorepair protein PhrA
MVEVAKYHDKKPVIKDIYLSYFCGAKISLIGLNGSGKRLATSNDRRHFQTLLLRKALERFLNAAQYNNFFID